MTELNRTEKIEHFARLTHEISERMHLNLSHDWPEHELSMPQFKALTFLASGRQRMGDLAKHLDISLSSATNLVDRLERKALVQRDHATDDRRVVTCELTNDGRTVISQFWRIGRERIDELMTGVTDDELDLILQALEILNRAWARAAPPVSDESSSIS